MGERRFETKALERDWETNERWEGIVRDYTAEDVLRLRGSIDIKYTLSPAPSRSTPAR